MNETFRLAASVRDRLSIDSWRIVLRIHEKFQLPDVTSCDLTDLLNITNQLIIDLIGLVDYGKQPESYVGICW